VLCEQAEKEKYNLSNAGDQSVVVTLLVDGLAHNSLGLHHLILSEKFKNLQSFKHAMTMSVPPGSLEDDYDRPYTGQGMLISE
jgi:hypothetical protein